jgi:hypothetical protein
MVLCVAVHCKMHYIFLSLIVSQVMHWLDFQVSIQWAASAATY